MPAIHTTIFNLTAECHPKEAFKEETFKVDNDLLNPNVSKSR